MVLQRAPQKSVVWGYTDTNQVITLRLGNKMYTTVSNSKPDNEFGESIWSVTLDPVSQEGPYDVHVTQPSPSGNITITLHDVLFGDVWICSGQSNMEFTVNMIFNASVEIANADKYPKIRTVLMDQVGVTCQRYVGFMVV